MANKTACCVLAENGELLGASLAIEDALRLMRREGGRVYRQSDGCELAKRQSFDAMALARAFGHGDAGNPSYYFTVAGHA